mgnify:CR=1 FL=1
MRQSYRIIPIYTADVSGVCSALYELGGMTVMHDPSGCNSTYNTHDEIRWYDQDSLIYISGLTEIDAIMGNDEKFIHDIEEAASELKPRFIALASSPIPYMNGTDFPALARLIQGRTGIDCFFVPTNGMHDYIAGAGSAFLALAQANGFNLTLADIISDGEEFSCNQTKSTNGGNPMPYDCFDDSYEMFLLSL